MARCYFPPSNIPNGPNDPNNKEANGSDNDMKESFLRNEFAKMALAALIPATNPGDLPDCLSEVEDDLDWEKSMVLARKCYMLADAMMIQKDS